MPRVAKNKTFSSMRLVAQEQIAKLQKVNIKNPFRWMESYTSLLMGIVVVIIGVLFVVSFAKQTHHIQETSSIATTASPTRVIQKLPVAKKPTEKPEQKIYTVEEGDDLWHISEKFYNSGYNYVDIVKANNISDPNAIFAGQTLTIPKIQPAIATTSPTPAVQNQVVQQNAGPAITGNSYTVMHGDNLWNIAVRAYGDGYKWTEIARVNNLSNPNLIHSGNIFNIPR